MSQRLLADCLSALRDTTRGEATAAVVTREVRCAAGALVQEHVRVRGATALWVTFGPGCTLRPKRDDDSDDEHYYYHRSRAEQTLTVKRSSAGAEHVVRSFRGDSEVLQPVLVPGEAVHVVLNCRADTVVTVHVRPMRSMWLGVSNGCGRKGAGGISAARVSSRVALRAVTEAVFVAFNAYPRCCSSPHQEAIISREPSLLWSLWVVEFILSTDVVSGDDGGQG